MTILLDVELAFSKGVPELDGSIPGSGDDLTVVGGERDGENIGSVSNKSSSGESSVKIP